MSNLTPTPLHVACTDQIKPLRGTNQGTGQTDVASEGVNAVVLPTDAWKDLKQKGVLSRTKQRVCSFLPDINLSFFSCLTYSHVMGLVLQRRNVIKKKEHIIIISKFSVHWTQQTTTTTTKENVVV